MKTTRTRLIIAGAVGTCIAVATLAVVLQHADGGGKGSAASRAPALAGAGNVAQSAPSYGSASSVASAFSKDTSGSAPNSEAGAPAAPSTGQGTAQPAQLPDTLGRKIVQTTDIDVKVKEVPRTFQDIVSAATAAGGFVASSTFSNADNAQVADLTVRVPADQYQSVLARIRGMGTVDTEKSDANDATEEYADLQARVRTLQATEQQYLTLLTQATNVNDIIAVQDRLTDVRGQIETAQGRINLLDHLTELATITVHLRPLGAVAQASTGGGAHPISAAQSAWAHSLEALRGLAAAALVVAVFSWWLVPPLAVLAFAARWWMGRRPRPALPA